MKTNFSFLVILILCLFQTACYPVRSVYPTPHGDPLVPTHLADNDQELTTTPHPASTQPPEVLIPMSPSVTLSMNRLTQSFATKVIAPVLPGENMAWWEPMPQYMLISLPGYPIRSDLIQPQIFIYPMEQLVKANENTGKVIASLQSLIQSPREIPNLPFLPLSSDTQMIHTHLQYLDFTTGQGLRYLVEFGNGISPINNAGLIYTYQGMTRDAKYYVAAVLPVNHPSLPADAAITGKEPPEFKSDYPTYRANIARVLNIQAPSTFTPNLTELDAMMASLEIR